MAAHGIDFGNHGHAELRILSAIAIAARRPAPPPPTTKTSWAAAALSLTSRLLNVNAPGVPRDRPGTLLPWNSSLEMRQP